MNNFQMQRAYLSVGSNVGDREANLRKAIDRVREFGDIQAVSSMYETEPVELQLQPWFLNCAVRLDTMLPPNVLLKQLLAVERELGRVRLKEKGPRTIDIDIVLFGDTIVDEPGLKIPHPAMTQRRFVLEPLAEIAGDAMHPVLKRTVGEILRSLPPGQVVRRLPGATEA